MTKIHLLMSGLFVAMFGFKVFSMPIDDQTTTEAIAELELELDNTTVTPSLNIDELPCYLIKNDGGVIKTVNMSRTEAGNDTYLDYEELCELPVVRRLSTATLQSLLG